jgi:hypothetical protein
MLPYYIWNLYGNYHVNSTYSAEMTDQLSPSDRKVRIHDVIMLLYVNISMAETELVEDLSQYRAPG